MPSDVRTRRLREPAKKGFCFVQQPADRGCERIMGLSFIQWLRSEQW